MGCQLGQRHNKSPSITHAPFTHSPFTHTTVKVNEACASKFGGVSTDTTPAALTTSAAAAPVPHTDTDHDNMDPASGSVAVKEPITVPAAVFSAIVNEYLPYHRTIETCIQYFTDLSGPAPVGGSRRDKTFKVEA